MDHERLSARGSEPVPETGYTPHRGSKGGTATEAPPSAPPPSGPPGYIPNPPPPGRRPGRGPGATVGIVLVVIGVLVLTVQFLPGVAWWSLWPLVIVIAGVVQAVTPGREGWGVNRLFDGLTTVAFGLVVLAVTTGFVGFDVIWRIISLWPVLLIAIGLDLLGKALHTSWLRALGSIAVIAALAYAVAVSTGDDGFVVTGGGGTPFETVSEPVDEVTEASLNLEAGAAEITLGSGNQLVEAEGSSPWGDPEFAIERSGDAAQVQLNLGEEGRPVVWPSRRGASLDANLSDEVVWDLSLELGVATLDADLSDLQVRRVDLKPGVAECKVRLGEVAQGVDEAVADVRSGIASVRISLPEGAEARVESESGLTAHDVGGAFESVGSGEWETPGFDEARDSGDGVWIISIRSGIGSVVVDTY